MNSENISVLLLDEGQFDMVQKHHILDITETLDCLPRYLFLFGCRVYGYYQLRLRKRGSYFVKQSRDRSVYYYFNAKTISSEEKRKILNIFQIKNRPRRSLSIRFSRQPKNFDVSWHSLRSFELIESHVSPLSPELRQILEELPSLSSGEEFSRLLPRARKMGKYLYNNLTDKSLREEIARSDELIIRAPFNFPVNYFFDGEQFLAARKRLVRHYRFTPVSSSPKRLKFVLAYNVHRSEPGMEEEYNAIRKIASSIDRLRFKGTRGGLDKMTMMSLMEGADVFHYIGHGSEEENSGILLAEGLFDMEDFSRLTNVPRLAIFSSCRFLDDRFFRWFFSLGGQVLIYFGTRVRSDSLAEFFKTFYWTFFNTDAEVSEALLAARKKSLPNNLNWAESHLIGNGSFRLI